MRSTAFRLIRKIPVDIRVGDVIKGEDGKEYSITKINGISFLDMRSFVVVGLNKEIKRKGE